MPGHVMSAEEMRQRYLSALEVGVAHGAIAVRDRQSFLAPKRTDELAADIQANRTQRNGNQVTSRVHTASEDYYGVFQETKDYYHHLAAEVRSAVEGVE
jgi:hypothetical protein